MKKIPFASILEKARSYRAEMTKFLRDMIAIPSESCQEKDVILRIKKEMEQVGFDKVVIDKMGNLLGYIGHGKHLIAMDAHIDTVGIGDIRTGRSTHTKAMKTKSTSADAAAATKRAAWPRWSTPAKSSRIFIWKMTIRYW